MFNFPVNYSSLKLLSSCLGEKSDSFRVHIKKARSLFVFFSPEVELSVRLFSSEMFTSCYSRKSVELIISMCEEK